MTPEELSKQFDDLCKKEMLMMRRKNADYSGSLDALKNLRLIEHLSDRAITPEQGILVRLSDKFSRVFGLVGQARQPQVDESIEDTLTDISVYAKLMIVLLRERGKEPPLVHP